MRLERHAQADTLVSERHFRNRRQSVESALAELDPTAGLSHEAGATPSFGRRSRPSSPSSNSV